MNDVIQKIYDIGIVPVIAIDDIHPTEVERRLSTLSDPVGLGQQLVAELDHWFQIH